MRWGGRKPSDTLACGDLAIWRAEGCSCVGPVLDAKAERARLGRQGRGAMSRVVTAPVCGFGHPRNPSPS